MSAEGAASWVSGLLIGTDVGGSLPLFDQHPKTAAVYLIGAAQLCESYASALAHRSRKTLSIDGGAAALHGQASVYRALQRAPA